MRRSPTAAVERRLLQSFWMAGFEGADHVNAHGDALDMVAITGHARSVGADFARLAPFSISTVRESLGWRLCEPSGGGRYDFARALAVSGAAERNGIQILWTFMHYGTPPDVSLLDDDFIDRFVDFAAAAARVLRPHHDAAPIYSPINEISFLAWAACESNLIHRYIGDRRDPRYRPMPDGFDVKRRLVKATLQAMAAIRAEDPRARFLHIDPLVHVVAPRDATPALAAEAARFREFQWQTWDMLSGRLEPELGGSAEALDIVGVNHYVTAQWEFGTGATLAWPGGDERRLPLRALLQETWQRYRRPIVVAETGHFGPDRARWLEEIDAEIRAGVQVEGVCLYPIIDRPDWNNLGHWHNSGLWDAAPAHVDIAQAIAESEGTFVAGRHLEPAFARTLAACALPLAHRFTEAA